MASWFSKIKSTFRVKPFRKRLQPTMSSFSTKDNNDGSNESPKKPLTRNSLVTEQKKKFKKLPLAEKRLLYKCGNSYVELNKIPIWPAYFKTKHLKAVDPPLYKVNKVLNEKISLFCGDITTLEIDAIVNAANKTLLGGGGVDGAIHRAAGDELLNETRSLGGCETGDAKLSLGYRLPAKYILHTVGPIGEQPRLLQSCYLTCLDMANENAIRSIAFPCISTGIYGYSNTNAAPVVLKTVRDWLENEENSKTIDRIIFCLFLTEDIVIYERLLPRYFPV